MRFYIALWVGKLIAALVNIIDKNRGSNFAGEKAIKIDKTMLKHFKVIPTSRMLFITGTNGKSTTNNLINHIFKENGFDVCTNLEGANLYPGIVTALIKKSNFLGSVKADFFIFEVDERSLANIRRELPAENILITNLQRDQVQRNGDPDFIVRKVKKALEIAKCNLYLNNDEPRSMGLSRYGNEVTTFGAQKHSLAFVKGETFATMPCPKCGHDIKFEYFNNDGVGNFKCINCDYESSNKPDFLAENIDFIKKEFYIGGIKFNMPYAEPHMLYNYSGAVAIANKFGNIEIKNIAKTFSTFKNIGGRYEILHYKDNIIKYMRFKQENPETVQTCLNIIKEDCDTKTVIIGLEPLKDFIPHYLPSFYLYDVDLAFLNDKSIEKIVIFSEGVAWDIEDCLIYQGIPKEKIVTIDGDDNNKIMSAIDNSKTKNIYLLTWLHAFETMKKFIEKEGK